MSELLRIGELAEHCGVSRRTIDYYTGLGLIAPADRTGGNFRLYDPSVVGRVHLIRRLEDHGVSLDDIVAALDRPAPDRTAVADLIGATVDRLREGSNADEATDRLVACAVDRAYALLNLAVDVITVITP